MKNILLYQDTFIVCTDGIKEYCNYEPPRDTDTTSNVLFNIISHSPFTENLYNTSRLEYGFYYVFRASWNNRYSSRDSASILKFVATLFKEYPT